MDIKDDMSSGLDLGSMDATMIARLSAVNHVRVASAAVANVIVPNIIAVAMVESGAVADAEKSTDILYFLWCYLFL